MPEQAEEKSKCQKKRGIRSGSADLRAAASIMVAVWISHRAVVEEE